MALSVPLSRFTPRVGGGSAFYVRRQRIPHTFTIMKTRDAIILTIALLLLTSFIRFDIAGQSVSLTWVMVLITAIWAAIDSSKIHLKRYKSGISYGPVVLFLGFLLLWIVAFPWYLIVRHKILTGTAVLKDGA